MGHAVLCRVERVGPSVPFGWTGRCGGCGYGTFGSLETELSVLTIQMFCLPSFKMIPGLLIPEPEKK